jgi:hypothetical protein
MRSANGIYQEREWKVQAVDDKALGWLEMGVNVQMSEASISMVNPCVSATETRPVLRWGPQVDEVSARDERIVGHEPEMRPAVDELLFGSEQLTPSQETLLDRVRHWELLGPARIRYGSVVIALPLAEIIARFVEWCRDRLPGLQSSCPDEGNQHAGKKDG